MNIKEYISSGIVESYVLGLASEEERLEFEQYCRQYPELVAARTEFEELLEKQAFAGAVTPPVTIKTQWLNTIRDGQGDREAARVIGMERRTPNISWLKYVAAAAVLLLVASSYFVFDLYSRNKQLQQSLSRYQVQIDSLTGQIAFEHRMMTNPDVAVVTMKGADKSQSSARVYWDTTSSDVYLVIKNMPQLPSEKQFQLWAFIKGKPAPADLGLFDLPAGNVILKMQNVQGAEAFAITIEKRGNGPVPQGPVETYGKAKL